MSEAKDLSSKKVARRGTRKGRNASTGKSAGSRILVQVKGTPANRRDWAKSRFGVRDGAFIEALMMHMMDDGRFGWVYRSDKDVIVPALVSRETKVRPRGASIVVNNLLGVVDGPGEVVVGLPLDDDEPEGRNLRAAAMLFETRMGQLDSPEDHLAYIRGKLAEASDRGVG